MNDKVNDQGWDEDRVWGDKGRVQHHYDTQDGDFVDRDQDKDDEL